MLNRRGFKSHKLIECRNYSNKVIMNNHDRFLQMSISDIISQYGSYEKFLNENNINIEVNEEFILQNYPDHAGDIRFITLLKKLVAKKKKSLTFVFVI